MAGRQGVALGTPVISALIPLHFCDVMAALVLHLSLLIDPSGNSVGFFSQHFDLAWHDSTGCVCRKQSGLEPVRHQFMCTCVLAANTGTMHFHDTRSGLV